MNCSVVRVFTNLHCADCVCLYSMHLAVFFLRETLGTQYGSVGIRFSILGAQIGSLKRPNKTLDLCLLQNLKIKQIHQEIRLSLQLIRSKGGVSQSRITSGGRTVEKVKNHCTR